MLGRKSYSRHELDQCKGAIQKQLAAYEALVKAAGATDDAVAAGVGAFEPLFFNNLVLALDRYFVHRLRAITGKDINPLNELELLADSLINHDGVLSASSVIKYVPDQSVLKLEIGDPIRLTASDFDGLSAAFLEELDRRFVGNPADVEPVEPQRRD